MNEDSPEADGRERSASMPLVNAVFRAFTILERLSERESWNLEELSRASGLAKPTAYRFLQTLQELGHVRRDGDERYSMTMRLFAMGSRALDHLDLFSLARPIAQALGDELGETVHMGVLDGLEAVYVLKIESKYTLRMYSRVGRRIPLHCTALGKCLLAWAEPEERRSLLAAIDPVAFTARTLVRVPDLEAELVRVRNAGYAFDDEEHEDGIHCIGAPVFDHTGAVVAALSASWPQFRWSPADEGLVAGRAARVAEAARRISEAMGWEG